MKPGIYAMPAEQYHADPCDQPSLSSGVARLICQDSPAHARHAHPRLNADWKPTFNERFDVGTAAHALLLEGDNVMEVVHGFEDWRKKEARDLRDDARRRGKVPLLADDAAAVSAMVASARAQLAAHRDGRHMFVDGEPERVLIWRDPEFDVWCRARLDWLRPGAIDDYKTTTASANPETLSRSLYDSGWDVQAAFYLRGLRVLTGTDAVFRFACQETYPPHALSVISLGPAALMLAEKKVRYALERWAYCLARGEWPGYPAQTAYATLPEYIEAAWLRKEEAEYAL